MWPSLFAFAERIFGQKKSMPQEQQGGSRSDRGGNWLSGGDESHRDRIDAVPSIFWRQTLAFEYVPQVPATIFAQNFDAAPVGIDLASHSTLEAIVEAGPAASGIKFIVRSIELGIASSTEIGADAIIVVQLTTSRSLGSFVDDDPSFFVGKRIQWCGHRRFLSWGFCNPTMFSRDHPVAKV